MDTEPTINTSAATSTVEFQWCQLAFAPNLLNIAALHISFELLYYTARTCRSYCCHCSVHGEQLFAQVPQDVREARRDELVELQQHVGQSFAGSLVGQQVLPN